MSYINTWEKDGVYRKYSHRVTGQEVIQALQDVHGDAKFDYIRYVINDLLDVTEHHVTDKEIRTIAAFDNAAALSNPNIKVAVVATMSTIQDLASMYSELISTSPYACEIFTTIGEARAWAT